jgi:hypothetical protein
VPLWSLCIIFESDCKEETIKPPNLALSSAVGMPSEDILRRMAEDIISVAVRRLINEIDHALFDEEQ